MQCYIKFCNNPNILTFLSKVSFNARTNNNIVTKNVYLWEAPPAGLLGVENDEESDEVPNNEEPEISAPDCIHQFYTADTASEIIIAIVNNTHGVKGDLTWQLGNTRSTDFTRYGEVEIFFE